MVTHKTEYYSAIKKKEILPFVTTWIDIRGIMLSEISKKNPKQILYDIMWNLKKQKTNKKNPKTELIDTKNRLVAARGRGWEWAK